ncbi:hypothetical protein BIW11_06765 [Tropilaelaps mercedesae]|uniref:Uncharacterized protein n=1 Tax=Tropilaelaps mercedesae TaxID=418985 RepID=A0A1V9XWP3_9ACAR|nr:hypothetical protein BIW11_06765 [Tropilaelaps mercedesae]
MHLHSRVHTCVRCFRKIS